MRWAASGYRGGAGVVAWGKVGCETALCPDVEFGKASCPITVRMSPSSGWRGGSFWEGGVCCAPVAIMVLGVTAWGELPIAG
jgi:hypothetical protein